MIGIKNFKMPTGCASCTFSLNLLDNEFDDGYYCCLQSKDGRYVKSHYCLHGKTHDKVGCPFTECEEIKKGHWTVNTYNDGSDELYDLGKCPYCGWNEDTRYIDLKEIKRCPSCGASLTFNRATITFSKNKDEI